MTFGSQDLTGANLAHQNLTNTVFAQTILTNTDFTGAAIHGATFGSPIGFAAAQFYSTANYANRDLTAVGLVKMDITGWNLAHQNLTNANFSGSNVTDADFTGAIVSGAILPNTFTPNQLYTTASYITGDLSGIGLGGNNLTQANLANQNLTSADFSGANLTHANFAGAMIKGAKFSIVTGFTPAQLFATASYANGDLAGIVLGKNNLTGWNFAHQNLTNADFGDAYTDPSLGNIEFGNSNLTNAYFGRVTFSHADFTNANLTNTALSAALHAPALELNNASFPFGIFTNANFSAIIQGAQFNFATGLTAGQLYSTASYIRGDLTGTGFAGNDLSGWNFSGHNLTWAGFSGSNLTNANFANATLLDADFTDAVINEANFSGAAGIHPKPVLPLRQLSEWRSHWHCRKPQRFNGMELCSSEPYQRHLFKLHPYQCRLHWRDRERSRFFLHERFYPQPTLQHRRLHQQ